MSERFSDITARIEGIRKLGSVVNAMRGIAAAHAQQARSELVAVDSYSGTIAAEIARILPLAPDAGTGAHAPRRPPALVLFLAEQGFAGNFSERVLDAIGSDFDTGRLFVVGTRGSALAAERGLVPAWQAAMPAHSTSIPALADRLAEALDRRMAAGAVELLDCTFMMATAGNPAEVHRRRLFPVDIAAFRSAADSNPPLLNLPAAELLGALVGEYIHAQLCHAALHAFAAESEARMAAMTSTRSHIERLLSDLQVTQQIARQEEITSEIIELAAGESASRPHRGRG